MGKCPSPRKLKIKKVSRRLVNIDLWDEIF
jgi:hypothetical protein